ncbi:cytochrome-c oxidase chain VIIc-like protein [Niveomyces insectorum RCEF 264]|uniref:Cytochrome c oxidase subunit 8, mitochondrial n=1 Tax=Niveomyces insectorum RCEF 264 TaxID=1081102 RepID=A0A167NQ88_9HYPO|nr:cytochrome-c oxidase chain VIIc-like protein [Niveomyces insectorum RCEF 264]
MFSRAAIRTSQAVAGRRAFHATPARFSSPYHYPEGPYSNIPFNPKSKYFGVIYWTSMTVAFFAPAGICVWQTYKPK